MNSFFVCRREENGYQQRLSSLLAEARRTSEVLTILSTTLMAFTSPGLHPRIWIFLISFRTGSNGDWESYLKASILEHQKICGGWYDVELFSVKVLDCAGFYYGFSACWAQYKVPNLLFVHLHLVLEYYGGLVMRNSVNLQTGI